MERSWIKLSKNGTDKGLLFLLLKLDVIDDTSYCDFVMQLSDLTSEFLTRKRRNYAKENRRKEQQSHYRHQPTIKPTKSKSFNR